MPNRAENDVSTRFVASVLFLSFFCIYTNRKSLIIISQNIYLKTYSVVLLLFSYILSIPTYISQSVHIYVNTIVATQILLISLVCAFSFTGFRKKNRNTHKSFVFSIFYSFPIFFPNHISFFLSMNMLIYFYIYIVFFSYSIVSDPERLGVSRGA